MENTLTSTNAIERCTTTRLCDETLILSNEVEALRREMNAMREAAQVVCVACAKVA